MDPGPCSRFSRIISPVTRSRASSQLMGSYPETPRFWMLRSPSGSQSTRLSGVRTRFGEYTIEREACACGASVVRRGGVNVRPRASMLQSPLSSSSRSMGVMRTILPSSTSTKTGPPVVQLVSLSTCPTLADLTLASVGDGLELGRRGDLGSNGVADHDEVEGVLRALHPLAAYDRCRAYVWNGVERRPRHVEGRA